MWCFTKQKGVLGTQMHKIANFKCPKEHEISVEMLSFYVSCSRSSPRLLAKQDICFKTGASIFCHQTSKRMVELELCPFWGSKKMKIS